MCEKPKPPSPAFGVPAVRKSGPATHAWQTPPPVQKPKPSSGVQ